MSKTWAGTVQDEAMSRGLFIDSWESARKGQGSGRMPSGNDSRVGMPYRLYEPLSVTEIKLRKCCPMPPDAARRRKQSCSRRGSRKQVPPGGIPMTGQEFGALRPELLKL